ncbi:site-specific integrase [Parabacteroides provencensis]|uniref:site-specific integrase n=1 Tax=Parabacteroides provencensis TaxID=1944636 RepID=UPI000C15E746|nr:site-specific integrase [Parabacteroides provencensis]
MKKSSFSIIFVTQNGKPKADGRVPILARITVNGEMCHFSTRQTILPGRWVAKDYRTMGRTPEEKQINEVLEQFKSTIKRKYESWVSKGEVVTASKIKNSIMSLDENSKQLIELCDLFVADYEKLTASRGYGQESLFRYQLTRTRLQEFLKDEYKTNDIPLADINKRMLDKLYLWLITEKKLANNTATKFIHRCSSIYRVAYDNGWVKANPFKSIKLHLDKVDRGYLTQQELARMMQKEFATKRLELVRDIFAFSCYTGFAYIDVTRLTKDMLEERGDGTIWICTHRQKTKVPVNIRLLDIPKMIIDKYAGQAKGDKLLPVPSNQKMNDYLKEIAAICGIDKPISYHVARHTFATQICLSNGVPMESVSKMLGHTNIKTTQLYARITDQKVSHDMEILAQKLNAVTI